jgi:hypothetical protein
MFVYTEVKRLWTEFRQLLAGTAFAQTHSNYSGICDSQSGTR